MPFRKKMKDNTNNCDLYEKTPMRRLLSLKSPSKVSENALAHSVAKLNMNILMMQVTCDTIIIDNHEVFICPNNLHGCVFQPEVLSKAKLNYVSLLKGN
jgi:hypothetical protein